MSQLNILDKSLLSASESVFCKDIQGHYLDCNDAFAQLHGFNSRKDALGKTALSTPSSSYHQRYMQDDQYIRTHGKPFYFLDNAFSEEQGIINLLTIKIPLPGNLIKGISIFLNNESFDKIFTRFIFIAEKFALNLKPDFMFQFIAKVIQVIEYRQNGEKRLFDYGRVSFSLREAQCLHYFFNHYSAEKTAEKIHISRKTVEFHLSKVKQKLNCHNTSQLTRLAIDYGFIDLMFMSF